MLSASQHISGGAALRAYSAGLLRGVPRTHQILSTSERFPIYPRNFSSVSDSEAEKSQQPPHSPQDGVPKPAAEGEELPLDPVEEEQSLAGEHAEHTMAEEEEEEGDFQSSELNFDESYPGEEEIPNPDSAALMSFRRSKRNQERHFLNRVADMDFKEDEVPSPFRYVDQETGEPLGYWEDFHTGEKRLVTESEWRREYEKLDWELGTMTRRKEREVTHRRMAKKSVEYLTELYGAETVREFMENPWREDHPILENPDAIRVRPWELKLPMDQELTPMFSSSERRFREFSQEEMESLYKEALLSLNPKIAELHDRRYLKGFEEALYLNDSSAEDDFTPIKASDDDGAHWKHRYSELLEEDKFDLPRMLDVNILRHPNWESPLFLLRPDLQLPETEPRRKDYLAELANRSGIRNAEGKTIEEISNEELFDFEPYIGGRQEEGTLEETEKESLYRGREVDVRSKDDSIFAAGTARLLLRARLLDQDPTLFDAPGMDEFRAMHYQRIFDALAKQSKARPEDSAFEIGYNVPEGEDLSQSELEQQQRDLADAVDFLKEQKKAHVEQEEVSASSETLSEDDWGYPNTSRNLDVLDDEVELRQPNYYYDMYEEELLRKQIDPGALASWRVPPEAFTGESPDSTLTQRVRDAMYKYHLLDPVKYSPRILAKLFGMSIPRIVGYLKLAAAKERLTARGFPVIRSEFLDFMTQGVIATEDHTIAPFIREAWRDFEQTTTAIVEVPQLDAYWDPPRPQTHRAYSDIRFVDDYVTIDMENYERSRHERWMTKSERALKAEQRQLAFAGPIGSDQPASYQPKVLDENLRRPSRHKTVLVDISDIKNANYRIAIQDRAGRVREPNSQEWEWIRSKERNRRSRFNYLRWKQARRYFPAAAHPVNPSSSSSSSYSRAAAESAV